MHLKLKHMCLIVGLMNLKGIKIKIPNLQCKNDGLKGHLIEKCYKLIGYPKGFKPNSDFNNQNNQNKLFLCIHLLLPMTVHLVIHRSRLEEMMLITSLVSNITSFFIS